MWYFVTAALGNPCRQLAHPWCPSNAIQSSWHYPHSTNEAVEALQVSMTCLRFWLVAEQDTNPGLLIPSCWEQPSSAWPTAFFFFFFFWREGQVLRIMEPPALCFSFQELCREYFFTELSELVHLGSQMGKRKN